MKALLTLVSLSWLLIGCQGTDVVPLEAKSIPIDAQSTAEALKLSDTHVRVNIKNSAEVVQFTADFRKGDKNLLLEYSLYPLATEDRPQPQPVTAMHELAGDAVPALDDAVTGAVLIHTNLQRAVLGQYDSWGCDLLPGRYNWIASCGPKGACCDVHDACYAANGCTAGSWTAPPWDKCQYKCNIPAVACFTTANPGPSVCCFKGNCGKPR